MLLPPFYIIIPLFFIIISNSVVIVIFLFLFPISCPLGIATLSLQQLSGLLWFYQGIDLCSKLPLLKIKISQHSVLSYLWGYNAFWQLFPPTSLFFTCQYPLLSYKFLEGKDYFLITLISSIMPREQVGISSIYIYTQICVNVINWCYLYTVIIMLILHHNTIIFLCLVFKALCIYNLNLNTEQDNGLNEFNMVICCFVCPTFIYFSSDKSTLIFPGERFLYYICSKGDKWHELQPWFHNGHVIDAWPVRAPHSLDSGDWLKDEQLAKKETKKLNSEISVTFWEDKIT